MRKIVPLFLAFIALIGPEIALAKPVVTLKLTGAIVGKAADGRTTLTPVEQAQPKSGDAIQYDIVAGNAGNSPALKLVPVGKIPAGTSYVDGSAKAARAHAEFSLDGGKTWAAVPMVRVKAPDGSVVLKKADPALYTTVRFITEGAIAPHQAVSYTYEVRVK